MLQSCVPYEVQVEMQTQWRGTWLSLLISAACFRASVDAFATDRSTRPAINHADYDSENARASAGVVAGAIPQPHRGWTSRGRRCGALASSSSPSSSRGEIKTGGTKGKYRSNGAGKHSDIIKSLLFNRGLSALDILSLLHRSTRGDRTLLQEATVSENELTNLIDEMVDRISPDVASAALLRLTSPSFLAYGGAESESSLYDEMLHALLDKLEVTFCGQRAELARQRIAKAEGELTIVPRQERYKAPPVMYIGSGRVLGWRGLAHLMLSLSNICDFLDRRSDGGTFVSRNLLVNISPREHVQMISFYDDIVSYISINSRLATSFVTYVDPQSLVTKVIRSVVVMSKGTGSMERTGPGDDNEVVDPEYELERSRSCDAYCRILSLILKKLSRPESIEKLSASHMSSVLAWLHQLREFQTMKVEEMPLKNLLMVFMKRLRKHSVRLGAAGNVLVKALWAATQLVHFCETANRKETRTEESLFVQLPGEFEHTSLLDSDVAEALAASVSDGVQRSEGRHIESAELRGGAVTLFHTLLKDIVNPPYNSTDESGAKLFTITVGRIADLLESATELGVDFNDITESATKILMWLAKGSDCEALRKCESKKKIARLLLALQRLRVGSGAYNKDVDYDLEHLCVRKIGERFLELSDFGQIEGKTLTAAVRASVMMFPGDQSATLPILNAASCLITKDGIDDHQPTNWDELEQLGEGSVLATCGAYELSSLLWAFAKAKHFDVGEFYLAVQYVLFPNILSFSPCMCAFKDFFMAITDCMLDEDVLATFTAASASRALWSSSALLSLIDVQDHVFGDLFLRERQLDLFHQLAPRLLVSQLSAQEISASLWALVQCEYLVNPGIFDALARLLAKQETLRSANPRTLSQALHAVTKMFFLEGPLQIRDDEDEDESFQVATPPYLLCVNDFLAAFLKSDFDTINQRHLTKVIWSIGHLNLPEIRDEKLVDDLVKLSSRLIGRRLLPLYVTREIAITTWGLGALGASRHTKAAVANLVNHLISSDNLLDDCKPEEASQILFTMGKLDLRNKSGK